MRRLAFVLFALLNLLPLTAGAAPIHVKGSDGVEVTLAHPAQRVVSLAPDLAELLYDIDAGDVLQGATEYTDYPAAAKALPRVGDAFHVDVEKVVALKPDLVLAWEGGTPQALIDRLRALHLPVLALGTHELLDIASNMETLGIATGHPDAAQLAADDFRTFLGILRARYANQAPLTLFYEISEKPLFTVGGRQSISKLMEVCGGRNVFADLTDLAPAVTLESVLARDPEVIVTGDGEGTATERLKAWLQWTDLTAVKQGNFVVLNDDWVSRATPRLLNSGKQLCEALQNIRAKQKSASH